MRAALRAAALALAVLAGAGAGKGETLRLEIAEARTMARDAWRQGNPELAYGLAQGLLRRDPQDPSALLVVAASAPMLGRATEGRQAARLAFSLAPTQGMKFEAARFAAGAAVAEGRMGLAQYWLRRAMTLAPSTEREARTLREFRAVRARNPLSVRLNFSIAPSSNLNDGAEGRYTMTDWVPEILSASAQALSGVRATAGVQVMRRLPARARSQTSLGFQLFGTANSLSAEAKALIAEDVAAGLPGLTGSDLNFALAEAVVEHRFLPGTEGPPLTLSASVGQSWYGGAPYARQARLALSQWRQIGPGTGLELTGSADLFAPEQGRNSQGLGVAARITRALSSGDVLSFGLVLREARSDSVNSAYRSAGVDVGYELGRPLGPVAVAGRIGAGWRDYAAYDMGLFMVEGGRQDQTIEAGLDLTLHQMSVAGFAPTVSFEARKTTSNVGRFNAEELGVSFGVRSLF